MTDDIDQVLERLLAAYRAGRQLALIMDYDGTLVPIVGHPRFAVLAPETRAVLKDLAALPRVAVGIVSGRSLDDLMNMVGLRGICYVGTSGLEYDLNGARFAHGNSREVSELLARASEGLARITQSFRGAWLERKPVGLALHYRDVAPERISELKSQASSVLSTFAGQICVTNGPMAFEVTPALGWTKGTAVRWLCKQTGNDVLPLYAGDHLNDADALATAAALRGIAIGVGPDAPPSAEHRLLDAAALINVLRRLSDSMAHFE
ncbi:MAG: trehalose-phosphatase [Planctomycetes bacterium]|nr:trehalose-phosphatase [Planctomycetota bacterium]